MNTVTTSSHPNGPYTTHRPIPPRDGIFTSGLSCEERGRGYYALRLNILVDTIEDKAEANLLLIEMRAAMKKIEDKFPANCDCQCAKSRWERHLAALLSIKDKVAKCDEGKI